ncbi:MAG: TraR/DksA family transcriptional regulator [Planctomycetota bacterium]
MDKQHENIRAWLTLRLREMTQGVASSLQELNTEDRHHLADLEELASDVSVDGVVFEQFRSSGDTITQIEKAIRRIDEGCYETCEACAEEIGRERLEALPFATQCIACKRREERTLNSH